MSAEGRIFQGHLTMRGRGLPLVATALVLITLAFGRGPAATAATAVSFWKVYAPGWNLVAGPGGSRLALHGEELISLDGSVAQYQATATAVKAGAGYWINYPVGAVLLLVGTPETVSQVHVGGRSWATIGNSGTRLASVRGADMALTYDPGAGFQMAGAIQPGQAALVYADTDADVFMDPYSPPPPRTAIVPTSRVLPAPPPPFPTTVQTPSAPAAGAPAAAAAGPTPVDELAYVFALNPLLNDVGTRVGHFADGIQVADPARPSDQIWVELRNDATAVNSDLAGVLLLDAPPRYAVVQANLILALADIGDGMTQTITGQLTTAQDRLTLGAGLLASGSRRLGLAIAQLPQ